MQHYRSLFGELVDSDADQRGAAEPDQVEGDNASARTRERSRG
jgi:hypothetical protein